MKMVMCNEQELVAKSKLLTKAWNNQHGIMCSIVPARHGFFSAGLIFGDGDTPRLGCWGVCWDTSLEGQKPVLGS